MKILRHNDTILPCSSSTAVAIGNFDGVHLGHQALIRQLVLEARARQLTPLVLTFHPAPQVFFATDYQSLPFCLTPVREKIALLARLGVDILKIHRFNLAFSQSSKQTFLTDYLLRQLGAKLVIVGKDFRFGYRREGNFSDLVAMAPSYGLTVLPSQSIKVAGRRVSSTWVRTALQNGEMGQVRALLGRPYRLSGKVAHGQKLARQLGAPTANLHCYAPRLAISGSYAVRILGLTGQPYYGVSYVRAKPLQDSHRTMVEVSILDFEASIYGQLITLEFMHKIRDDQPFSNPEQLRAVIAQDIAAARYFFKQSCVGYERDYSPPLQSSHRVESAIL